MKIISTVSRAAEVVKCSRKHAERLNKSFRLIFIMQYFKIVQIYIVIDEFHLLELIISDESFT